MNATNDVIEQRSTRPLLLNQACRILVPSDFSASSHAALEYATFLAWRTGASIDLLHVLGVHPAMGRERRRVLAVEYNARMAELDELAGAHRKAGVQIRCRLEFGSVAATISRVATSSRADLVVMGFQRRVDVVAVDRGHSEPGRAMPRHPHACAGPARSTSLPAYRQDVTREGSPP